jgi:excisionase family DNA binding protein
MDTLEKKHAFYSISDIAEKLKVSQKTIRRHIASGKLKSSKIGSSYRIANDALEDFINSNLLQNDSVIQYDILGKEISVDPKVKTK